MLNNQGEIKKAVNQAIELLLWANEQLGIEAPVVQKQEQEKDSLTAQEIAEKYPPELRQHLIITECPQDKAWIVKTKFVSHEYWNKMDDIARRLGGLWIKDDKESRWEIPR
jgi:hypothetical protein